MKYLSIIMSVAGLVIGVFGLCPQAQASIFIHEVLADPPALIGDANQDGTVSSTQDEFVELYNPTAQAVTLTGWTLYDATGLRHTFGSAVIDPLGVFVVFGGGTPSAAGFSFEKASSGGLSLNNTGDFVRLKDAQGFLVDEFSYGSEGNDNQSLVRLSPLSGIVLHSEITGTVFSPGTAQVPQTPEASTVPEPATICYLAFGLAALNGVRRFQGPSATP